MCLVTTEKTKILKNSVPMLQILQLSCTFGIWWNVMIHWYNDRRHIFTRQVKCRISVSRLPGIDSLPADLWISFDIILYNYIFIYFSPKHNSWNFWWRCYQTFTIWRNQTFLPVQNPSARNESWLTELWSTRYSNAQVQSQLSYQF